MFCAKCGAEVPDEYGFCTRCGTPATKPSTSPEAEPPAVAAPARTPNRSFLGRGVRTLLPVMLALGVISGFMAADRLTLHWYTPEDTSGSVSELKSEVSGVTRDISGLESRLSSLSSQVSTLKSDVASVGLTGDFEADFANLGRDARIANALAIISLVSNYGGFQRSDSPAGEACFGWLMFGDGSITDCGFTR